VEYNADRLVDTTPRAAEIRSIEYWSLHKMNCNSIGFVWDRS
jgi:hypothetical protein